MNVPPMTAELTLYRTDRFYVGSSINAGNWFASTPCEIALVNCNDQAQVDYDNRLYICGLLNSFSMRANCESSARTRRETDRAACRQRLQCASSNDCQQDIVAPHDYRCCPSGQACGERCVPSCPPRKRILIDDTTCTCVCDPLLQQCDALQIRDSDSCLCRCPTEAEVPCTTIGAHRNLLTCICECPAGQIACSGRCIDPQLDANNCGGCGIACGNAKGCCDGLCKSLDTDANCGRCGTNLMPPWKCCIPPQSEMGTPTLIGTNSACKDCFDSCDAQSPGCCPADATHGTAYCDAPMTSQHCGRCASAQPCAMGQDCCAAKVKPSLYSCFDLTSSNAHCGSCGNECRAGTVCQHRLCICKSGGLPCGPTDSHGPAKCCPANTATQRWSCCDNDCFDVKSTDAHCGVCNNACRAPATCQNGVCVCPPGRLPCGPIDSHGPAKCCPADTATQHWGCCNHDCFDLKSTGAHCGVCNNACRAPATCQNGVCVCPSGRVPCGSVDNRGPTKCCPPDTADQHWGCCGTDCVDLNNDNSHCGSCSNSCPGEVTNFGTYQSTCQNGTCVCPPGWFACGGLCRANPVCCLPSQGWTKFGGPYACQAGSWCCNSLLGCCN